MWPAKVIKMNPVVNHSAGMLQGFKSLPIHTLLLQRSNDTLHHPVLLRAMGRDELLLQLTCLVLSDHFHLETKAPVVELLFHPETYSSGV